LCCTLVANFRIEGHQSGSRSQALLPDRDIVAVNKNGSAIVWVSRPNAARHDCGYLQY
jgi:hypothetical protein